MNELDPKDVWITAKVPSYLKADVEALAKQEERPVSWVVRQALSRHVSNFLAEREAA